MQSKEFSDIARKWGRYMRCVTRTALAVRAHDGSWLLQYGFMAFSPDEIPTSPLSVETKSILAIRETTALGDDGSAAIEAMRRTPPPFKLAVTPFSCRQEAMCLRTIMVYIFPDSLALSDFPV